jgi:hypothetical protein
MANQKFNNLERRHLGFKQILNKKLMFLTYFKTFGLASVATTFFICLIIVLFKDNYFYHDGILTDFYNVLLRKGIDFLQNSKIQTVYSEVYKTKILFDDSYIKSINRMFFLDSIFMILKILGWFILSFFIITKISNKRIDESVKDIYEDKILAGTEILLNGKYTNKEKELGQYFPEDGVFISCVYERKVIDKTKQK